MTELPAAVRTVAATMRAIATWDEGLSWLHEAANTCERTWDGGCCPICDETRCDAGCPLEELRAELMRRPGVGDDALRGYAEAKRSAAGSLRTMSGLLRQGTRMESTLGNLADALAEQLEAPSPLDALWPQRLPLTKPIPTIWDGPHQPAQLPRACYDASFGRVHVRPCCRC